MTTIQSVELRKNYDTYMKRAMKGEVIRVSYRNKPAIMLVADKDAHTSSNVNALLEVSEKLRKKIPKQKLKKNTKNVCYRYEDRI